MGWSGAGGQLCSTVVATECTAANPELAFAGTVRMSGVTRTLGGALVTTGLDRFSLADIERSTAAGWVVAGLLGFSQSYVGAGNYSLLPIFSRAGAYRFNILINGLIAGANVSTAFGLRNLTVVPAAAVGATSYATGVGLTTADIDILSQVLIQGVDAFGNLAPYDAVLSVTLKTNFDNRVLPTSYLGGGVHQLEYSATYGGVTTLSISLASAAIVASPWTFIVPTRCTPGYFAGDANTGLCVPCPSGSYVSVPNALACNLCGTAMRSPIGSTTQRNCSCDRGYYIPAGALSNPAATLVCYPCPTGASCAGDYSAPTALPGFTGGSNADTFLTCPNRGACAGGSKCTRGYKGYLCAECERGYYKLGQSCNKCRPELFIVIVIILIIAAIAFCILLIAVNIADRKVFGMASLIIGINALQISALYGNVDLPWPNAARQFFNGLSFVNLNFEISSPECSFHVSDPWLFKWILTMLLPVFFAALFAALFGIGALILILRGRYGDDLEARTSIAWIKKLVRPTRLNVAQLRSGTIRSYYHALALLYMPLASATLRYLQCTPIDGRFVMVGNPARQCYTKSYWNFFPAVMVFVVVYAIGIPTFIVALLVTVKHRFGFIALCIRYGFLVGRFRESAYWFESVIMARKLAVVLAVSIWRDGPAAGATIVFIMIGAAVNVAKTTPYLIQQHSNLDTTVCVGAASVMIGGLITSLPLARTVVILAALLVSVLAIIAGILYDFFKLRNAYEKDEETFDNSVGEVGTVDHAPGVDSFGTIGVGAVSYNGDSFDDPDGISMVTASFHSIGPDAMLAPGPTPIALSAYQSNSALSTASVGTHVASRTGAVMMAAGAFGGFENGVVGSTESTDTEGEIFINPGYSLGYDAMPLVQPPPPMPAAAASVPPPPSMLPADDEHFL